MKPRLAFLLLPLLIAACAPNISRGPAATTGSSQPNATGAATQTNPNSVPAVPLDPSVRFLTDPSIGFPGFVDAMQFSEKKAALAAELQTLRHLMDVLPYDPEASRQSLIRLASRLKALETPAVDSINAINDTLNGSITDYLYQFPGTRTRYELGLLRSMTAAEFTPTATTDQRLIELRRKLAAIDYEADVSRALIAYDKYFLDYGRFVRDNINKICDTHKFSCLK